MLSAAPEAAEEYLSTLYREDQQARVRHPGWQNPHQPAAEYQRNSTRGIADDFQDLRR